MWVCICAFWIVFSKFLRYLFKYSKFIEFLSILVIFARFIYCLSGGNCNFLQISRDLRGSKEGVRENCFKDLSLTKLGIFWCDFAMVSQEVRFEKKLRVESSKSLYFRLLCTLQHVLIPLSVWRLFWKQGLMWLSKMWEINNWDKGEAVRLTGKSI